MIRHFTTLVLLATYSAIAFCGQGLHFWGEGTCCQSDTGQAECSHHSKCSVASKSKKSCCHSHTKHSHANAASGDSKNAGTSKRNRTGYAVETDHPEHDCTNCIICLHQSLGQWFLGVIVESNRINVCQDSPQFSAGVTPLLILYSQAQPRAPPVLG